LPQVFRFGEERLGEVVADGWGSGCPALEPQFFFTRAQGNLGAVWQAVVCKILDFKTCFVNMCTNSQ